MLLHHTGKTSTDPKSKKGWHSTDFSYSAFGSSELTNWTRASMVLQRHDEEKFELKLTKRERRAKARDLTNNITYSLWLKHSPQGICWVQTDPPPREEKEKKRANARTKKPFNYEGFLASVKNEHMTATQLAERAMDYATISRSTAFATVLPELKRRMQFDEEFKTYTPAP